MIELEIIQMYYGDRVAKRSGVPLINHINEGLVILDAIYADDVVKGAYCLHPLLQDDSAMRDNWAEVAKKARASCCILATEYRSKAQSYLCRPETDSWSSEEIAKRVGQLIEPVQLMLIADKVQNRKDFLIYHANTHERKEQLNHYFLNWAAFLGLDSNKLSELTKLIEVTE